MTVILSIVRNPHKQISNPARVNESSLTQTVDNDIFNILTTPIYTLDRSM